MPATSCGNPILFDLGIGDCSFTVELTWDGTSVPPTCNGTVSRVRWNNVDARTFYARLPATKIGPIVYQMVPGAASASGDVTSRPLLHALGLDDRSDVAGATGGIGMSTLPPQAGETLINP